MQLDNYYHLSYSSACNRVWRGPQTKESLNDQASIAFTRDVIKNCVLVIRQNPLKKKLMTWLECVPCCNLVKYLRFLSHCQTIRIITGNALNKIQCDHWLGLGHIPAGGWREEDTRPGKLFPGSPQPAVTWAQLAASSPPGHTSSNSSAHQHMAQLLS